MDHYYTQFLVKQKGSKTPNNNNNIDLNLNINRKIKELLINISLLTLLQDNNYNLFTSYSLVEQIDIIIVSLVNKSFEYTLINKTLDVINKDLFIYN